MSKNVFQIAMEKGAISSKTQSWDSPLCNGEAYIHIAQNDVHAVNQYIEQLEETNRILRENILERE